jgi:soluble lytic murein transglycosylase-like protein
MGKIKIFCLAATLLLALGTEAYPFCFEEAGAQYGINPQILRAIAKVESNFNPAAINKNSNGTYDVGLMQINSIWATTIGKERWNSLGDACSNTKTGAWILSMCMNKYGYTWKAIGCYNSQTPEKRDRYSKMVFNQLQRVKPLAQEAAYTPLKNKLEALVRDNADNWVGEAAQGKDRKFVVKVPANMPVPKEAQQEPPSLTDSALQSALPGLVAPQTSSFSIGPDTDQAEQGESLNSVPSITP